MRSGVDAVPQAAAAEVAGFLLGDNPHDAAIHRDDRVVGAKAFRRGVGQDRKSAGAAETGSAMQ
jgi:hypothetical protein